MASKKKILITGSGGFIFSNFIRYILHEHKSFNIASVDRVQKQKAMQNVYINKDHEFYIGDLSDKHLLDVIFEVEKPDIVIHGIHDKDNLVSEFSNTKNIIDKCLEYNSRLIYLSDYGVYGCQNSEDEQPFIESNPCNPKEINDSVKSACEILINSSANYGLRYDILRLCNVFGPWQPQEKLIPSIIKSVINFENAIIHSKGENIREWVHVLDLSKAIMSVIENSNENSIYNIGSGYSFSNIEIFQNTCNILGYGHNFVEFTHAKQINCFRKEIDSSKIKSLNWKCSLSFKDALTQTIKWYINNKWFLRN